jgi:hypothetical protein
VHSVETQPDSAGHKTAMNSSIESSTRTKSSSPSGSYSCRVIDVAYRVCESESSVVFLKNAARVFSEASQDFMKLMLRISDHQLSQSFIEVCALGP